MISLSVRYHDDLHAWFCQLHVLYSCVVQQLLLYRHDCKAKVLDGDVKVLLIYCVR